MRVPRNQCVAIIPVSKWNRTTHQCPFQTSGNSDLCGAHLRTKRLRDAKIAKLQDAEDAMIDLVTLGSALEQCSAREESLYLRQVEMAKNRIRSIFAYREETI